MNAVTALSPGNAPVRVEATSVLSMGLPNWCLGQCTHTGRSLSILLVIVTIGYSVTTKMTLTSSGSSFDPLELKKMEHTSPRLSNCSHCARRQLPRNLYEVVVTYTLCAQRPYRLVPHSVQHSILLCYCCVRDQFGPEVDFPPTGNAQGTSSNE